MSNFSKTIRSSADFHTVAQQTLADAFEHASRIVHINVVYHRPDSPALVQEFTWGSEDLLIPAMKLVERLADTKKGFVSARGVYELENAINELDDLIEAVKADLDAARRLPAQFDLSFKNTPRREHVLMIQSVPFQRAQHFLRHWHDKLENLETGGGLLNTVTIAHAPLPDIGSTRMRRRIIGPTSALH